MSAFNVRPRKGLLSLCSANGLNFHILTTLTELVAMLLHSAFTQMVRKNYNGFTKQKIEHTILSRCAQACSGHQSEAIFKAEMSRNSPGSLFCDCPITNNDIVNANAIFGPSLPCSKRKQVTVKTKQVEPSYVSIPTSVVKHHKYIMLVVDVLFVSSLSFLISLFCDIWFVTVAL